MTSRKDSSVDSDQHGERRRKLWAFIQDDSIAIGFEKFDRDGAGA